jgi:hypothetical protein
MCLTANPTANKPYRVQSILEEFFPWLIADKILHNLQLISTTALKPSGIVEDIALMIREYDFVCDVMLTALHPSLD